MTIIVRSLTAEAFGVRPTTSICFLTTKGFALASRDRTIPTVALLTSAELKNSGGGLLTIFKHSFCDKPAYNSSFLLCRQTQRSISSCTSFGICSSTTFNFQHWLLSSTIASPISSSSGQTDIKSRHSRKLINVSGKRFKLSNYDNEIFLHSISSFHFLLL